MLREILDPSLAAISAQTAFLPVRDGRHSVPFLLRESCHTRSLSPVEDIYCTRRPFVLGVIQHLSFFAPTGGLYLQPSVSRDIKSEASESDECSVLKYREKVAQFMMTKARPVPLSWYSTLRRNPVR